MKLEDYNEMAFDTSKIDEMNDKLDNRLESILIEMSSKILPKFVVSDKLSIPVMCVYDGIITPMQVILDKEDVYKDENHIQNVISIIKKNIIFSNKKLTDVRLDRDERETAYISK